MTRLKRIEAIIREVLIPKHLEIYDESGMHHVPKGSESHFKLVVVSTLFDKLTKIERYRVIHKLLAEELQNGLHALSLHLYTEDEWDKTQNTPSSPHCRGGFDKKA